MSARAHLNDCGGQQNRSLACGKGLQSSNLVLGWHAAVKQPAAEVTQGLGLLQLPELFLCCLAGTDMRSYQSPLSIDMYESFAVSF